jgi:hypothetical protein
MDCFKELFWQQQQRRLTYHACSKCLKKAVPAETVLLNIVVKLTIFFEPPHFAWQS